MTAPVGVVPHNTARLHFSLMGGSSDGSIGIQYSGPSFNSTEAQLSTWATGAATAIAALAQPTLTGMLSDGCEINGITLSYSLGTVQQSAAYAGIVPVVGTGTVPRPGQDALCFSLRTSRTGKSYRGRLYWPYTGGAVTGTGQAAFVGPTALAELNALMKAIAGASPVAGLVPVVWSRLHDVTTPVTQLGTDFAVDTQRRRKHPPVQPLTAPF